MPDTHQSTVIAAWEHDPFAAVLEGPPTLSQPVQRSLPDLDPPGLPVGIAGPRPAPEIFNVGTEGFRYWALADSLARAAGYWSGRVPKGTTWQPDNGTRLVAHPDDGVNLNAFYDRNGLHFFHGSVRGTTVFSAESPDVACHEFGHAVLDGRTTIGTHNRIFHFASIGAEVYLTPRHTIQTSESFNFLFRLWQRREFPITQR